MIPLFCVVHYPQTDGVSTPDATRLVPTPHFLSADIGNFEAPILPFYGHFATGSYSLYVRSPCIARPRLLGGGSPGDSAAQYVRITLEIFACVHFKRHLWPVSG